MNPSGLSVSTQWLGADEAIISWEATLCRPFTLSLPRIHDGLPVEHNLLPLVGVTYPPDVNAGWDEETRFGGIFFNMSEGQGPFTSHLMHVSEDVGSVDIMNTVVDISTPGVSMNDIPPVRQGVKVVTPMARRVLVSDQNYPEEVEQALLGGDIKVLWNLGGEDVWWDATFDEFQLNISFRSGSLQQYSAGVPKNCFLLSYFPRGIYQAERYYSFLNWEDRIIIHPMRSGIFATHFKIPGDEGYSSD